MLPTVEWGGSKRDALPEGPSQRTRAGEMEKLVHRTDRRIDRLPARAAQRGDAAMLARCRVHLTYAWRHRRLARIAAPMLFTELVQHRKLFNRDPHLPRWADKVTVKNEVAAILGSEWVIPTWWHGAQLPEEVAWPYPFVVKSRHGCNQIAFVRSPDVDWQAIRRRARRWVVSRYGHWLDEWLYSAIPQGLLLEPFIGTDGVLPIDYKLFVFGGQVAFVQVHLDREEAHRWVVLDRDWRPASVTACVPERPKSLTAMIEAAETLCRGFDFVRVDFYEVGGRPKFGEMTFYPGSGLDPLDPPELDAVMGALWRAAGVDPVPR